MAATERLFGSSIKRREDPRLITGKGVYVDDVKLPATTYASFVRSPHAHARIKAIDSSAARKLPGVVAVYTGKELSAGGVKSLPVEWFLPTINLPPHLPLAVDRARYMGDAVAVVIAESPYVARDAADLVDVDYEPLPVVTDAVRATEGGAPKLHDEAPDNVSFRWSLGDKDKTDAAFRGAARVVKEHFVNHRLIPNAIEPRAALASANPATGEITLWVTTQNPHVHRLLMAAFVLGIPEHKLRVISPDVGGGFGSKIFVYPEECVVTWASRALGRPVKWTAERRESFMTDAHGRDHQTDAEMALDAGGRILGLRVKSVELRRRNFISPDQFPYQTPVAVMYDSGNYAGALDKALEILNYGAFRREQDKLRQQGRYLGVGFSTYVEACGLAPSQVAGALGAQAGLYESATVRVHPTGKVTVFTGSHSHGQGHETTFAQIAADELGLPMDDIEIVHGDTGQVPFGMGTYGSRSGPVGGAAIYLSLQK